MDKSWRNDDGNHNHHGTRIETQWAERNSQGSMADTTDKNLFAINDTLFPSNNTLIIPRFVSNHNIINDTLIPHCPN